MNNALPTDYLIAGFIGILSEDLSFTPRSTEDLTRLIELYFDDHFVKMDNFAKVWKGLERIGVIEVTRDKYAGNIIDVNRIRANDIFVGARAGISDGINYALTLGEANIRRAWMSQAFWEDFALEAEDEVVGSEATYSADDPKFVPASDRIVSLSHNSPEWHEISNCIKSLQDDVRGWNGNPEHPGERERILHGLEAAENLWQSTELKWVQIKVGIIMAIEDAQNSIGKFFSLASGVLLTEAIKILIKNANDRIDWGSF